MKVEEFGNSWEYDKAKRDERKRTKRGRDVKRSRKGQWQPVGADD
jgi:hypothetical protein